jgi:dihydrofolate synthase / folylpolyglutamate synthase
MTYKETIDYLYAKLPMFSRIGAAAIKKDLHNTLALCQALGNPHSKFKTIHIAGTNGKGSVSHMLAAILQTAGYKTGLYTSPHLHDFRERIKVNGEMVSEDFVIDFTQRMQGQVELLEPSFFEITVAMAFEYFAEQQVDVAVIETGLGGRLDSTNVITPELSIITNIGWDHMNLLGNTLKQIAFEKAGIIKKNIPVVVGEVLKETKPVFELKAKEENTSIVFAQEKFKIEKAELQKGLLKTEVKKKNSHISDFYEMDLTGLYQTKNLLAVLTSVEQLQKLGWKISAEDVQTALSHSKQINALHGRWEIIQQHPTVVLDVGHNEDGVNQIVHQLQHSTFNQLHIIIGMVKDKEIEKVLALLPKDAAYYFTKAQIPRALDETLLMEKAGMFGLKGKSFTEVNLALTSAKEKAAADDLILVCGSVFLVGEVALTGKQNL